MDILIIFVINMIYFIFFWSQNLKLKSVYLKSLIITLFTSILLTGCGGGGGVAISEIDAWWDSVNNTEGVASTENIVSKKNSVETSWKAVVSNNQTYTWASDTNVDFSYTKINVKGLEAAHTSGWSGLGTKIRIVDDFPCTNCVAKVVGGKYDWQHGGNVWAIAQAVAPEATFKLDDTFNGGTSWNTVDNDVDALNLSLGVPLTKGSSLIGQKVGAYNFVVGELTTMANANPNAVVVQAAGNNGSISSLTQSRGCKTINSRNTADSCNDSFYSLQSRYYGSLDRHIYVGAYDISNSDLTTYSVAAGETANHFIVADGSSLLDSGQGTSYAAPRVSGVISLISQKFPNLTAAQRKKLILHTADDLGTKGVDSYYGHGLLNVTSALSPLGKLH